MKKFVSLALTSAIVVSVFSISACNNDTNNQNSEITSNNSNQSSVESSVESVIEISIEESKPAITDEQIAILEADIKGHTGVPEFTCKSDSIDAKSVTDGKIIELITDNKSDSYSSLVSKQFMSAAASAGFKKAVSYDTDNTPSSYNDALASAVNNHYNSVIMFGNINKDNIGTQIEQTQANGIKVLSAGNAGIEQKEHYVDDIVPINYQFIGKLLADWAIVKQKGKVNALAINYSSSGKSNAIYEGFAKEFQKYVTSGYCTTINTSSLEIGNGLATKVKSALAEDSNINYVIVFDDSLINDTVSGVTQSSKTLPIIATGGSPEAFDTVQKSNIEMLVAQSYEWTAYAMIDYAVRVMAKTDLPKEQDVPVRVVTPDVVKKELEDYNSYDIDGFHEICFGSNFLAGYSALWKL